jgi:outer membrane immunogenic protein
MGPVVALPAGFGAPAIPGTGDAGLGLLPTSHSLRRDGVIGGVYAGYNWQVGRGVYGIEADISPLDSRKSDLKSLFDTFAGVPRLNGSTVQIDARSNWLASVRGRIGYAWDRTLIYGTGGAAFTHTDYSLNLVTTPDSFNGVPSSSIGFGQDKVGYAIGVGAEWMATQNWILRLEYLHYAFRGSSGSLPIVGDTCTAAVNCRLVASTSDLNFDSVRVGVSYKWGGPVVAKY